MDGVLLNIITNQGANSVAIETLFAIKLTKSGMMEQIHLQDLETRIIERNQTVEEGKPVNYHLDPGEHLITLSKARLSRKGIANQIRVHVFSADKEPVNAFVGLWGGIDRDEDPEGIQETWEFPQIRSILELYAATYIPLS